MTAVVNLFNDVSGAVLVAVANTLWQSVTVVAAVWAVLRFLPRINAATRHAIWWAVLAVIVAMPMAPALFHAAPIAPARVAATPAAVAATPVPAPAAEIPARTMPAAPIPARAAEFSLRAGSWPLRIFALWLVVFAVQLLRIGWSYRYLRGIRRRAFPAPAEMRRDFDVWLLACGVHRPARLLISNEIVSPLAMGFRAPVVVVPESLLNEFTGSDLDHVVLHELSHIARRDDWTNLAARIGWAFVALHPAAVWVLRQIEREREMACDDWVVAATGQARPYAASLARLFELCFTRRRALLATGMAERASELGDRIEMLLRRGRDFSARARIGIIAACAAALLLVLAAGSLAPRWIALAQDASTPIPQIAATDVAPAPPAAPAEAPAEQAAPATPAARPAAPPRQTAAPAAPARPAPNRGNFLAALVAAGYGDLSVDDIIALKNSGVDAPFLSGISEAGWGKLPPKDLISLREHGVSPEYLRDLQAWANKGISVQEVISLRDNGVSPDYVRDIESAGLGAFTMPQVIDFRHHGVRSELLRELKSEGFQKIEPREIVELQDNGVGPHNLQEARQYGSSLTVRQIIRLKQGGVI